MLAVPPALSRSLSVLRSLQHILSDLYFNQASRDSLRERERDILMMDKFSWWLHCENIALLRGNGMHLGHRLHMFRRCLRNCKVRGWYFGNGCSKTWFDRQEYIGLYERSRNKCWFVKTDIVPVIMAGIIGIYGLVVSVLISDGLKQQLPLFNGFIQLGAGLSVGLSGLAAGWASPVPCWALSKSALYSF